MTEAVQFEPVPLFFDAPSRIPLAAPIWGRFWTRHVEIHDLIFTWALRGVATATLEPGGGFVVGRRRHRRPPRAGGRAIVPSSPASCLVPAVKPEFVHPARATHAGSSRATQWER